MIRSETGLYYALQEVLKAAEQPMTCTELYDIPLIRKYASSANRVSDYLGNMWRDNLLKREPATRTDFSSARWAYSWRGRRRSKNIPKPVVEVIELPTYTITITITPKLRE